VSYQDGGGGGYRGVGLPYVGERHLGAKLVGEDHQPLGGAHLLARLQAHGLALVPGHLPLPTVCQGQLHIQASDDWG